MEWSGLEGTRCGLWLLVRLVENICGICTMGVLRTVRFDGCSLGNASDAEVATRKSTVIRARRLRIVAHALSTTTMNAISLF